MKKCTHCNDGWYQLLGPKLRCDKCAGTGLCSEPDSPVVNQLSLTFSDQADCFPYHTDPVEVRIRTREIPTGEMSPFAGWIPVSGINLDVSIQEACFQFLDDNGYTGEYWLIKVVDMTSSTPPRFVVLISDHEPDTRYYQFTKAGRIFRL
jgi:hypothetical protein